jgi:hypothetical protein
MRQPLATVHAGNLYWVRQDAIRLELRVAERIDDRDVGDAVAVTDADRYVGCLQIERPKPRRHLGVRLTAGCADLMRAWQRIARRA